MSSSPRSLYKTLTNTADPVGGIVRNNVSKQNTARAALDPVGIVKQNYIEGKPMTPASVLDPQGQFVPTADQQATREAEANAIADAPAQAEVAATSDANSALRAKNLRRRASALLTTGAGDGGGALLSSVMAYGKTSLGG